MTQTNKVYRLEFEHELYENSEIVKMGCYRHTDDVLAHMWWYEEMIALHNCNNNNPNIWSDGFTPRHDLFCGFDSIDKLKDWFNEYLVYFIDWGLVVREYTLNTEYVTGRSNKQIMFSENTIIDSKILVNKENFSIFDLSK